MKWILGILLFTSLQAQAKSTPYLITRYMAKEYCSCRFVVKQSRKVCINENKTFKILFRVTEDRDKKEVTVKNFSTTARAHFIDDSQGCILDNGSPPN